MELMGPNLQTYQLIVQALKNFLTCAQFEKYKKGWLLLPEVVMILLI